MSRRGPSRLTRFQSGLVAVVILGGASLIGWFQPNPFDDPYRVAAEFEETSGLRERSPVRIAGIDVGKVTGVEPRRGGGARVEMELRDSALPLHSDTELKIRPRIFFEGNFFVDLRPGTPSAPELEEGSTIPPGQTAAPVQIGDVLAGLQSDTRSDLQTLLGVTGRAFEGGAAESLNRGARRAGPALRDLSLATDAALGERPTADLQRVLRGTSRTVRAFAADEEALKGLVTNLNVTAGALAEEDAALSASIPALRDTLRAGGPALRALNGTFPPLRSLAREALPGVERLEPVLEEVLPLTVQARALVGPDELRATTRRLRLATPSLNRLLEVTPPLLSRARAASRCTERVLVPFIESDFPDPDFPSNTGTVNEKLQRSFIGLAGESRTVDANQSYFHASVVPPALQVRPAPPPNPTVPPTHRPDVPCETQEPPNLAAPGANVSETGGLNPRTSDTRAVDGPSLAVRRRALGRAQGVVNRWFRDLERRRTRLLERRRWR